MKSQKQHNLIVVEDASASYSSIHQWKVCGLVGGSAGFSLHPLKNFNIWGDGGVIVTRSEDLYEKLRLYRNHGMKTRDEIAIWGHNSRLDTLQALIALRLLPEAKKITDLRISNAKTYDKAFKELDEFIHIPERIPGIKQVYHTYVIRVKEGTNFLNICRENEKPAKSIFQSLFIYRNSQPLGYKKVNFPVCEEHW